MLRISRTVNAFRRLPYQHFLNKFLLPRCKRCDLNQLPVRHYAGESKAQIPAEAEVVVVGGGIIGCFTLYHLARLGCAPVLLERHKLTAGTTWHTNGLVWRVRPGETDTMLLNATRNALLELEIEEPAGWTENGGLFIANNKTRLDEYARLYTIGRALGVECHLLAPQEVKDRWPLLNVEDVTGALYSPGDGVIDPSTLCTTLTKRARQMGAKVYEGIDVIGLDVKDGPFRGQMVDRINTTSGPIKTQAVVNCTGVWCDDILQPLYPSLPLPQVSMEHSIVVMEPIPGVRDMPNVRDHDANMCLRVQGDSLVVGGYELNAPTCKVDRSFSFGLFDLKMDNYLEIMEGAIHRVPKLADVGIKADLCGPESFTPDRKPILGEDWDIRGLYHGFGFNSSGVMLSGGCSEQLAQWIVHGRPSLDMAAYDCRRYPRRAGSWRNWSEERSHESYTSNYSVVFPHNQPLAGRATITDPLYQKLSDVGCFWEESLCWERPGFFTSEPLQLKPYDWKGAFEKIPHEDYPYRDVLKEGHTFNLPSYYKQIRSEYVAMTQSSSLVNRSSSGKILLSGPDVERAVDWLFLKDVQRGAGSLSSSLVLNKRAGIEADVTIFSLDADTRLPCEGEAHYFIQCGSGYGPYVMRLLRDMCTDEGLNVDLKSMTNDISCLMVIGPKSHKVIQAAIVYEASILGGSHILCQVGDKPVRLARYDEDKWEFQIPLADLPFVYDALMDAGTDYGLRNSGYRALNILQIEKGIPSWHSDIRSDDTPLEAAIWSPKNLVNNDRDFVGKEALLQQASNGISKSRVILQVPNCRPLWGSEGIVRNGHLAGIVRRADYSFQKEASLAIGYVSHDCLPANSDRELLQKDSWEVESQGERYPAKVYHP